MDQYVDYAEYYDHEGHEARDIPFYLEYAAEAGSPVLELACGTGRVLVPMVEAGLEVTGLDFSANMLERCRRKLLERGLEDWAELVLGDMSAFELGRHDFNLIYVPLRSFMHLFTHEAQIACLERAHAHLRPGATFIVDIYAPEFKILARDPSAEFEERYRFELPNGRQVTKEERFLRNDRARQINHSEIRFREYDSTGTLVRERRVPMETRYTFRYELQLLFERAGLEVVDVFRDYAKNPFDGTGEIIMVGRRPA